MHVDAAYTGGSSDGTTARPFTTIQVAVDAVKVGGLVAIAEGTYLENVRVTKSIRLRGRCPSKVEIRGGLAEAAALLVSGGSTVAVSGVSVTGGGYGIMAVRSTVDIDGVVARDLVVDGIEIVRGTATIRRSLVERARSHGISVFSANVTVESSVIRDTLPRVTDKLVGRGIYVAIEPGTKTRSEVVVRRSLVERNHDSGISVFGSKATIEATVVRDTQPRVADDTNGRGIGATVDRATGLRPELIVRGCVVDRNRTFGISLFGAVAQIQTTVVKNTLVDTRSKLYGNGIYVDVFEDSSLRSELTLESSLVDNNRYNGVSLFGAKATIETTIVRATLPEEASKDHGNGVYADVDPTTGIPTDLTLRRTLVDRNHTSGVSVFGSSAIVEACVVRDTQPAPASNVDGTGVYSGVDPTSGRPAELEIRQTYVYRTHSNAITIAGGKLTLDRSVIRDANIDGVAVIGRRFYGLTEPASAIVRDSFISGNKRAGVALFGELQLSLARTRLACHKPDLAKIGWTSKGEDIQPVIDTSAGGNECGCATFGPCKVESADVSAMPPPEALK